MSATVTADDVLTWEVQLDRLDLEILRVERLIKAMAPLDEPPWLEPEQIGPMPVELLPRALEIQQRQEAAQRALVRALRHTVRQRSLAERLAAPEQTARYVDVSA